MVVVIYSIVDSFTNVSNKMIKFILEGTSNMGVSCDGAWSAVWADKFFYFPFPVFHWSSYLALEKAVGCIGVTVLPLVRIQPGYKPEKSKIQKTGKIDSEK